MITRSLGTFTVAAVCLGALLLAAGCSSSSGGGTDTGTGNSPGSGSGGASATGGSNGFGGSNGSGGSNGTGGFAPGSGGVSASGGSNGAGGGNPGSGGHGGSSATGGSNGAGGNPGSGGSSSGAAGQAGGADQNGVALAKPCTSISTSRGYLNLGDMRLINNRWGADTLNCSGAMYTVTAGCDKSLSWMFSRPACGGSRGDPDFPEVEFGVAPFGNTSNLLTTPAFSSTTLLPIQIKNLNSASVSLTNYSTTFTNPSFWDSNFEFWISKQDPRTNANAQVYAEIIMFLGWNAQRNNSSAGGWTCDKSGTVTSGGATFNLCHQSDNWSSGWRFFNFNLSNGPSSNFNGTGDVKAILDWVMKNYSGFTTDMWLTRIEVGTEIDDNTAGSAAIKNISFEINGTVKSPTFAQ